MAEAQRGSDPKTPSSIDLRELVDAYGNRLLRSACLLCGNRTEAQDMVQETYIQALRSGDRFRRDSAVYTWLHGILLNLCRRHYRKQKRLVYEEEHVLGAAYQSAPAEEMDRNTAAKGLQLAVRKLSPIHREIIVLRYYEGLKIGEIASHLGLSKGTIKSRLHYAVRSLVDLVPGEMNLFVADDTHSMEP